MEAAAQISFVLVFLAAPFENTLLEGWKLTRVHFRRDVKGEKILKSLKKEGRMN